MKKILILLSVFFIFLFITFFTETRVLSVEPTSLWSLLNSNSDSAFDASDFKPSQGGHILLSETEVGSTVGQRQEDVDESAEQVRSEFKQRSFDLYQTDDLRSALRQVNAIFSRSEMSSKEKLDALTYLRLMAFDNPETAAIALSEYVESGEQVETGLPHGLRIGGSMQSAPTVRIFALNLLSQIDMDAGAHLATAMLQGNPTRDEYAVLFQSILKRGTEQDKELANRSAHNIIYSEKVKTDHTPSELESFDVPVYLKDTSTLPRFAELHKLGDDDVRFASYTALYNLTQSVPTESLAVLNGQTDALGEAPLLRADIFALADLRYSGDRKQIETYLLRDDVGFDEVEKFVALYPNNNSFTGANILTERIQTSRSRGERTTELWSDIVQEWIVDPRFEKRKDQLQTLKVLLLEYER